jgi:hypothetical protein
LIALVLAASLAAQAVDIATGLRGGINIPRLSGGGGNELSRDYESILAPNVGVVAEYGLGGGASLLLEANYNGQGGQRKGYQAYQQTAEGQYYYADITIKCLLYYLEIPLMLKYEGHIAERWSWFIQGGPYAGYLISAEQETRGTSQIYTDANRTPLTVDGQALPAQSFDADTDIKSELNDWNVGLTAGVGVAYRLDDRHQLFLDVRGEYGLISIQKNTATSGSSKTGCASMLLGYKLNFGR